MATGAASEDVFAAIASEVASALRPRLVQIFRWERDATVTVVGTWGHDPNPFPAGSSWPWDDQSLDAVTEHLRSGRPVRIEDVQDSLDGMLAETGMSVGVGSAAGAPILLGGELWGHISVQMSRGAPLPDGVEDRLLEITELVASAIAGSTAREQLERLVEEQAALRRVAVLVATGEPPDQVFDAVAGELGQLLQVGSSGLLRFQDKHIATVVAGWGRLAKILPVGTSVPIGGRNVITEIARTGRPARDDFGRSASGVFAEHARRPGTGTSIGAPIHVAGRLWGALVVAAPGGGPLPRDAEPRLAQFSELVGTAIANAEARVELARLADEQAALRRLATLVAEEAPADEVFAKVGVEVAGVLGPAIDHAILRYEADETATVLAGSSPPTSGGIVVGERLGLDGSSVTARVYRERRAVRADAYADTEGDIAEHAAKHEITSAIGCPIVVQGTLWGSMVVAHREPGPFPLGTERRVQQFTDLVATALANAQARADLQRLAEEQAALRRVATLVAQAPPPSEIFDAVIAEVAQLLGAQLVSLMRYEGTEAITVVARRGHDPKLVRVGMRLRVEGESVSGRVLRTGQSARINLREEGHGEIARLFIQAKAENTVGAPVTVEGRLWGVMTASWGRPEVPPRDAEERLNHFAELLGTAIANADSRDQLAASRARVLSAGDEARRRVVRDLHDGAQQRLVHTIVTLKLAHRALAKDPASSEPLVAEALRHAEQSNAELRELAHGILPSALTLGGLRAGVDAVVARLGLPVRAEVTAERLAPEIEASAYFMVAEALTNVVKHAQATRAEVSARIDDGTLRIEVRDDGIGGADPTGHGLLGIGDRVAALGGHMRLESSTPGAGTVLAVALPLPGAAR